MTSIRFLFGEKSPRRFFNPVRSKAEVKHQFIEIKDKIQSLEDKLNSNSAGNLTHLEEISQLLANVKLDLENVKTDINKWKNMRKKDNGK